MRPKFVRLPPDSLMISAEFTILPPELLVRFKKLTINPDLVCRLELIYQGDSVAYSIVVIDHSRTHRTKIVVHNIVSGSTAGVICYATVVCDSPHPSFARFQSS